jgi:nucleotide-binding universal stress UspA family protein
MSANKRILLPVDVTHPHPEFIAQLNQLISLSGATVHILYVHEELPAMENMLRTLAHSPDEFDAKVKSEATKVLEQFSAEAQKFGATVTHEIVGGPAAMMIEAVAKDEKFELTALTAGSKPGIDKYLLGRVSSKVVRHAPGTVLLMRGEAQTKITNVVAGVDGSQESLAALQEAVQLFDLADKGIKVTLVNVVSVHPIFTMLSTVESATAIENNLKMSGEVLLAQAEELLSRLGVKNYEMKLKEGNPADGLLEAATECGASLVIIGSQGKGAVEHFLMGSTSTRLASHAQCPVAIFKNRNGKS